MFTFMHRVVLSLFIRIYLIEYYFPYLILNLLSLSLEVCTKCAEGENRILNSISRKCECKLGFKENPESKICEKCFNINGECLSVCPKNTILD